MIFGGEWFADWSASAASIAKTGIVILALLLAAVHAGRSERWRDAARRILASRWAAASFAVLLLFGIIALADSILLPVFEERGGVSVHVGSRSLLEYLYDPVREETLSAPFASETFEGARSRPLRSVHPLGTDLNGRDVLLSAMRGARTAFIIGGLTVIVVVPFGIAFGLLSGYFGGKTDAAVTYVFSTIESVPEILLLICLMKLMGQGLTQISIALGITTWVGLCRVVRGETMKVRELPYVRSARALGAGETRIILRHILPNLMHIIIIYAVLRFSGLVLSEAILSYLGIGVGPETGSWGAMIDQARSDLARYPVVWWNIASAGSFLFLLILSANILGDRVRDVLDPRLRGRNL